MATWAAFSASRAEYPKRKKLSFKLFAIDRTWQTCTTTCKYYILIHSYSSCPFTSISVIYTNRMYQKYRYKNNELGKLDNLSCFAVNDFSNLLNEKLQKIALFRFFAKFIFKRL